MAVLCARVCVCVFKKNEDRSEHACDFLVLVNIRTITG